jgi:FkbM family methyltransferase
LQRKVGQVLVNRAQDPLPIGDKIDNGKIDNATAIHMERLKNLVRVAAAKFGYQITARVDPFSDMQRFIPADTRPVILDIGANAGQTVKRFTASCPSSVIHSFEPSSETFELLKQNTTGEKDVHLWPCAVGSSVGKQTFLENSEADMSSFLELSSAGWGEVKKRAVVDVITVDRFLVDQSIGSIDILKSDTQGYELEVFKGAEETMRSNRIGLVYFEFIFSDMYRNLPRFDEVFRYLTDRGFLLVSIYDIHHQKHLADWADVLFVNREYYRRSRAAG